jgi:hypothetical protein
MAIVSALRTDYEVKVRDANQRILTNAQYLVLLNEALQEWQNRVEELRRENAIATVVNQYDYAAPSDIIKLVTAIWMPTGSELRVVGQTELMREAGYRLTSVGTPSLITQDENNGRLRIYPAAPSTSVTTTINDAGGIDASVTTIGITAQTTFRAPATWVLIESEKILSQSVSETSLASCRRGMGGTTAATHADTTAITELDLHLVYSYAPPALSADGDSPAINARFHKYLNWYVLATSLKLDGRDGEAAVAERKWEQSIREAKRDVKRIQSASPFGILQSGY